MKSRVKVVLQRAPLAAVADFSTPTADEQKTFEFVQTLKEARGGPVHDEPDAEQHRRAGEQSRPHDLGSFAKKVVGHVEKLGGPDERDKGGEADRLSSKDKPGAG